MDATLFMEASAAALLLAQSLILFLLNSIDRRITRLETLAMQKPFAQHAGD